MQCTFWDSTYSKNLQNIPSWFSRFCDWGLTPVQRDKWPIWAGGGGPRQVWVTIAWAVTKRGDAGRGTRRTLCFLESVKISELKGNRTKKKKRGSSIQFREAACWGWDCKYCSIAAHKHQPAFSLMFAKCLDGGVSIQYSWSSAQNGERKLSDLCSLFSSESVKVEEVEFERILLCNKKKLGK